MSIEAYSITTSHGLVDHSFPVSFYWEIEMKQGSPAINQHVLPSVYMDMIFPISGSIAMTDFGAVRDTPFVSSILKTGIQLEFGPGMRLFGIRFDPVYASQLIDARASELLQGPNDLDVISRKDLSIQLTTVVEQTEGFQDRIDRVNKVISQRCFGNGDARKTTCRATLNYIRENPHVKAKDLSTLTGYSSRWIEKLYVETLGMSPQQMIRITRFNRFLTHLGHCDHTNLASIASECGYFDQSHLIREFHRFSPGVPNELRRRFPLLTRVMNSLH